MAAVEVADSHPFVCGIISLLLNKCTEMLAFDYKKGTLERTMKFLVALTGNSYLDQNHVNLELYYLSQLMINLLLGADNDKYFETASALPKGNNGEEFVTEENSPPIVSVVNQLGTTTATTAEYVNEIVGDLMDYTEAATGQETGQGMVIKEEPLELAMEIKKETLDDLQLHATLFNGSSNTSTSNTATVVAVDPSLTAVPSTSANVTPLPVATTTTELKHDYEALFIMMDNGEFGLKKIEEMHTQFHQIKSEQAYASDLTAGATSAVLLASELKQEGNFQVCGDAVNVDDGDDEEEEDDNESEVLVGGGGGEEEDDEMCVITTKMCDTEDVALVCQCMGRLAGFWSYMYRECSYLLLKRIDQFFLGGVILLKCEYEWLVRAIQAVFALGEVPFREFSSHVDKLHVTITPDYVTVQLNVSDFV